MALKLAMLVTDAYGGIGGIAKFNRDVLDALGGTSLVERVYALPRLIYFDFKDKTPETVIYDRSAAGTKGPYVLRTAKLARRVKKLDVVICGHINLLPIAWALARYTRSRLHLIIHGIDAWTPHRQPLVAHLVRKVDQVISVSRHSAERFSSWAGLRAEGVTIIPNCVDLDVFKPEPKNHLLQIRYGLGNSPVILTMGRLGAKERYKGFDEILEAMPALLNRFANLKYLIVGEGPDRARLEAKRDTLGLREHVVFCGYIPESEKVAHYNLADAYIMPSRGEGFGIVLIEAAACGLPIVGSCSDGSREALLDGSLGHLIEPRNKAQLIDAIGIALDGSKVLPHTRNPKVEVYSAKHFVGHIRAWCEREASMSRGSQARTQL